ncbi:MAG: glycosyltransferase, partial [Akkermansiaceae bacterium]|nr:glycosyltransferase [Akkermansiaceae bacterium]
MKVALLKNILPPYRIEFFRELSHLCDLRVICDAMTEPNRSWTVDPSTFGFDYVVMGESGKLFDHKRKDLGYTESRVRYSGRGFRKELERFQPDAIISAEFGMRTLAALRFARGRIPVGIWSEGTRHTEKQVKGPRLWVRKMLMRRASGLWTNGAASLRYLDDLGRGDRAVAVGITGISTHAYYAAAQEMQERRDEIRSAHGLTGTALVFVGALAGRKGVPQLMEALEKLDQSDVPESSVILVGEGPLRDDLAALAGKLKRIRIILPGHQDQRGVQELLAAGDVFVMPTLDDNWPLVTLEALVSGIPQIGSIFNGASEDLAAREGVGCFLDPTDREALTNQLESVMRNPPPRVPEETVHWARDYYSPQQQAQRAHALILEMVERT